MEPDSIICELNVPKVFQNGLYDIHFLWRKYGIAPARCEHDTMLLHHALHPEMLKGLGFLGSLYSTEPAWKLMRPKGKQTLKDEGRSKMYEHTNLNWKGNYAD
jgi:DNA polymerase I-like protein with 3'-5' exonuclease and polymerase domains